jgi:hypothetical protein
MGNSSAERPSASQDGLCPMELVHLYPGPVLTFYKFVAELEFSRPCFPPLCNFGVRLQKAKTAQKGRQDLGEMSLRVRMPVRSRKKMDI